VNYNCLSKQADIGKFGDFDLKGNKDTWGHPPCHPCKK